LLIEGITSSNHKAARICCDLVYKHKVLELNAFIAQCFNSEDNLVRHYGAKLLENLTGDDNELMFSRFKDCFMPIRREAFKVSLAKGCLSSDQLRTFLFDSSPCLREMAVKQALALSIDVKQVYVDVLLQPQSSVRIKRYALWSLVHLNINSANDEVMALLDSPFISLRRQSLVTLIALEGEKAFTILKAKLLSGLLCEQKTAAQLVVKYNIYLDVSDILLIYQSRSDFSSIKLCCYLGSNKNKWLCLHLLVCLLELVESSQQKCDMQSFLFDRLARWHFHFNNSGTQPSRQQVLAINQALHSYGKVSSSSSLKPYLFGLQSFGIKPTGFLI